MIGKSLQSTNDVNNTMGSKSSIARLVNVKR